MAETARTAMIDFFMMGSLSGCPDWLLVLE